MLVANPRFRVLGACLRLGAPPFPRQSKMDVGAPSFCEAKGWALRPGTSIDLEYTTIQSRPSRADISKPSDSSGVPSERRCCACCDSSLGKRITKTHSSLPKARAQAVGRSAQKKSDPPPVRRNPRAFRLIPSPCPPCLRGEAFSSHFGNFWLLKFLFDHDFS